MFEKYKADQELVIQTLKDKELKTLRREQLLWDKQKKAADILPSKKERTEIDTLKQQMMDIQDAAKQKEVRLVLSQDRMKRRADSLAKRNAELLEEIKVLEQDRALYVEKLFSLRARFL